MKKQIFILHGWAMRDGDKSREMWRPFMDFLKTADFVPVLLKIPGLSAPLDEVSPKAQAAFFRIYSSGSESLVISTGMYNEMSIPLFTASPKAEAA